MSTRQCFQEHWLTNTQFQDWLARVDGTPSKAYCQLCHKQLSAEITSLKRHRKSRQHVALEGRQRATSNEPTSEAQGVDGIGNGVAYATIIFIVFLAEPNLPFR